MNPTKRGACRAALLAATLLGGFFTSDDAFALGVEYRANFYFGEDEAGKPVDGGQGQLSTLFAWYW